MVMQDRAGSKTPCAPSPSPAPDASSTCAGGCASNASIEALNLECFCIGVDQEALHASLQALLVTHGLPEGLAESHPNLFSAIPVFVSRRHVAQMEKVVTAIEEVSALPVYQLAVMSWAPHIARFDPGSPGGLLGLDFHLGDSGARLIEINTNPGGILLNTLLGHAQQACMPDLTVPPADLRQVENSVMEAMLTEWRLQRGTAPLRFLAILDESPRQQYLYAEFVLFRELFQRHGYRAEICSPEDLIRRQGRLWLHENPVDMIYNRLTDFAFEQPRQATLRAAYLAEEVVVSPHPYAHALYADKRNLSLLGNREFLRAACASDSSIDVLAAAVPTTELVTPENRALLWERRRHLFFKPSAGFGSKASYRGDKLTLKVWDQIARGSYVAQELVTAGERLLSPASVPMKVDLRCYAYQGEPLLYAARMYRGQTTNFRTPGGGFAPVLSTNAGLADAASSSTLAIERAENEGWPPGATRPNGSTRPC